MLTLYARLIRQFSRRPAVFGLLFLVLSVGLFFGASQVRLDGDLTRLLPDSSPTVQGLRKLEKAYGDEIGRVTIVLQGPDVKANREAADALGVSLQGVEGVSRLETIDPRAEIRPFRLLYIDSADLEKLDERLSKRIRWEKQRANPFFVDVGDRPQPEVDTSDIEAKYDSKTGTRTYYEGPNGEVLAFVHPSFPASRLDDSKKLIDLVNQNVTQTLKGFPGVSYELTGRYVKRVEQQDILTRDITSATPVALILLTLFLLVYFRSFISAILVVLPLAVGTAAGMSFAVLVFGDLNILTGFLGAILMGLGVDYGIHLISRFLEVKRTVDDPAEAWLGAFETAGRASIYAGLTTMIALGSLAVSTFRAFFEFGVIAMGGIFLILLTYATLLPILLFILPTNFLRPSLASVIGGFLDRRLKSFSATERPKHMWALIVASSTALIAAAVIGGIGLPKLSFDRSFASLAMSEGRAWELDEMVNKVLGGSQTPAVVMVDSSAHREAVVSELHARKAGPDGEAISAILSLGDVIPVDQDKKLEILQGLQDQIDKVPKSAQTEVLVDFGAEITRVLEHGKMTKKNLPPNIYVPFSRRDNPDAGVVLIMPGVDLNGAEGSAAFSDLIRGLPGSQAGQTIDAVADSLLLVDILNYVVRDTEWMVGLTLAGLFGVSFLAFGFRLDMFRLLGFLSFSIISAAGVVAFTGHEFNFINVLVLPIWLGLGVDASFHLLIHLRAHPGDFGELISTTVSVSAAFLTSIIGFTTLTMSHHVGLFSLGWVAACGLLVILGCSIAIAAIMGAREVLRPLP